MKRFMARQAYLLFVFILSVLFVSGCGGGGAETGHWLPSRVLSIAVTPATASIPMGAPQQFMAVATYTDGTSQDVTASSIWSSGATGVATINSASGLAAGVTVGTSVITADFEGKSGSVTLTVTTATLVSIAVTPATASIPMGLTQAFIATGTFTDGTTLDISNIATWSSGTVAVATVVSPGVATGVSVGAATITATSGAQSGSATLTVTAATLSSIAVTPLTASIPMGLTQRFVATGTYSDGTSVDISSLVTWSSGTLAVATIVSPGLATGRSVGTATITAALGGNSGSATLTVTAATLSSIVVTPLTASTPMGLTKPFVATGAYSDGTSVDISSTVTWSSGTTAVATVVSPGVATGKSVGTAAITATLSGKSGSATLTVTAATLSSIAVTPLTASIPMGLTKRFVATGAYSDGTSVDISSTVTWSSGTTAVATVVSPGVATGKSVGTAAITATLSGKSGSATLTVTAATLSSIAVTPATAAVAIGGTQAFVAKGTYSDSSIVDISSTVTWSSGTTGVASVVSPGTATGVSGGTATITATLSGKSGSGTLTVLAAGVTLSSIAVTPLTASVAIGGTQTFVAKGTYSDASVVDISNLVTWTSNNLPVATVVSPGVSTGLSGGTATITATSGTKSGAGTLTVLPAGVTLSSIAVTPLTASVAIGGTQTFVAKGTYSDLSVLDISNLVTWTSSNLPVATVVSPGVATGLSAGTATVTATSGTKSGAGTLTVSAPLGPAPVDLGTAGDFVILTKTGITTTGVTNITGDIGVSPITSTAITGFSLAMDSTNTFSTSPQVTGKVYAADYTAPTPAKMTAAINDLHTAYVDAAGRATPDATELYAGNLSGQTITPGLYKWSTGVSINAASTVTLSGGANDVWIFQISGDITANPGASVTLLGGAQAKNIFWQVGGPTGVTLDTTSAFKGIILAAKAIVFKNGATLVNGRALAETNVTLIANTITEP